jgi:hypothetical protein
VNDRGTARKKKPFADILKNHHQYNHMKEEDKFKLSGSDFEGLCVFRTGLYREEEKVWKKLCTWCQ